MVPAETIGGSPNTREQKQGGALAIDFWHEIAYAEEQQFIAEKEIGVQETIVSAAEIIREVVFAALKLTPRLDGSILESVT